MRFSSIIFITYSLFQNLFTIQVLAQLECFVTDDPDYDYKVILAGDGGTSKKDVTFYYTLDSTAISGRLSFNGKAWVGWAVSRDGNMIGSEAVIGLPSDNTAYEYDLNAKKKKGVVARDPSNTLIKSSVVQQGQQTNLTFTRQYSAIGSITIDPDGMNTFLWAYGKNNKLNVHKQKRSFELDLSSICTGTVKTNAPSLSMVPSQSPTGFPPLDLFISNDPSYDCMAFVVGNPAARNQKGDVTIYYSIKSRTMSIRVTYMGEGWLGWAVSRDGQMIGSEAVIGLPDNPNASGQYDLNAKNIEGVNLRLPQTISDLSVSQDKDMTTLAFTTLLSELGRLSINPNGVNTFLWAHGGMSNELGYHGMNKGSYELNLGAQCNVELPTLAPSISNAPSISDAPSISAFPSASVESTFPSASEMPVTFYTLDPTYYPTLYPTEYPTETPQCKEKNQPCEQKQDCCKKKCGKKKGKKVCKK